MQQIERYYEVLQYEKIKDLQNMGMVVGNAVAYGEGHLKGEKFAEFIKNLDPRTKKDVNNNIELMKQQGLPIEDV